MAERAAIFAKRREREELKTRLEAFRAQLAEEKQREKEGGRGVARSESKGACGQGVPRGGEGRREVSQRRDTCVWRMRRGGSL